MAKGVDRFVPLIALPTQNHHMGKESRIRILIQDYQSLLRIYLFANEKTTEVIADKVAQTLMLYKDNNAFEYLFNTPFSQHIKARDSEGGEVNCSTTILSLVTGIIRYHGLKLFSSSNKLIFTQSLNLKIQWTKDYQKSENMLKS